MFASASADGDARVRPFALCARQAEDPVSTTHIVTSGVAGTMVASGAGLLQYGMISRIAIAWLITLPVTILIAGGLPYFLANPHF